MRAFLTSAVLTVTVLTMNAAPVSAHPPREAALVDSWYHRYLGRHIDPVGASDHIRALRHGTPAEVVEAAILSSPEYYFRAGSTPEGFVARLFADVLGRRAYPEEFGRYVHRVRCHGRNAVALQVLNERSLALVAPVAPAAYGPAPVIVQPSPVVVRPYPLEPTVIVPSYRPAPVVVDPIPSVSIRLRFGR